jgi:Uma2 family endonuclease
MATEPVPRRFTVDDYHQMAEAGILREDDRVELINGEILEMSPIGGRHVARVNRITRILVERLGDIAIVSIQNPIRLGQYQEPEPDVAVIRGRSYGDELPGTEDVLFLMEVSSTSLAFDRGTKLPLYATARIPEVWLVDIPGEAIERDTNPVGDTYSVTVRVGRGEAIESTVLPNLRLRTNDVFA